MNLSMSYLHRDREFWSTRQEKAVALEQTEPWRGLCVFGTMDYEIRKGAMKPGLHAGCRCGDSLLKKEGIQLIRSRINGRNQLRGPHVMKHGCLPKKEGIKFIPRCRCDLAG